ncbi:hypothetical protein [Ruminiclostridium cellobioparum]|uniref:PemK-like protein n=1 Tax=Ruminiclostridium cellobioparum subsp. termitidis CT1112 TaxID=1195236 RepID=S0FP81_RUMCE|nr:hypothetical protein [Ruminiclostridium cellobioparum]EMS72176.1 hypothetical protein CTER_1913 [Ruminiclostridium cellobioparum subsp. termitidis CT1112]
MSIKDDMDESAKILDGIQNYDKDGFANQLKYWLKELEFFYNKVVPKQTGNPSTSFYEITKSIRPKEGQVAFFNLRRGYPKEVYDGHYCYILKDFGIKYLVIPTTSVKDKSEANPEFEFDIKMKNFKNELITRLQISDIRAIDVQRFNEKREVFNVITDKEIIVKEILRILSLNVDTIIKEE